MRVGEFSKRTFYGSATRFTTSIVMFLVFSIPLCRFKLRAFAIGKNEPENGPRLLRLCS